MGGLRERRLGRRLGMLLAASRRLALSFPLAPVALRHLAVRSRGGWLLAALGAGS